jgi:hypothetical protein
MFLSNNCTENTHLLHEEAVTLEKITDVRERLDSERKGKQIDIGGEEGGICTGRSVHRFSLEKLPEEMEYQGLVTIST